MNKMLLLCCICLQLISSAQTDTAFFNPNEFVVYVSADTLKNKPWLGNPLYIKDRVYFKNGHKVDEKKTYPNGFVYIAYDTLGMARKHTFDITHLKSTIQSEITSTGELFYVHAATGYTTSYFLLPNGLVSSFLFDLKTNSDTLLQKELNTLLLQFAPSELKKYLNNKTELYYKITFLRNGLFESFGYLIKRNNELYKIGVWQEFNPMCNCLIQKAYR